MNSLFHLIMHTTNYFNYRCNSKLQFLRLFFFPSDKVVDFSIGIDPLLVIPGGPLPPNQILPGAPAPPVVAIWFDHSPTEFNGLDIRV